MAIPVVRERQYVAMCAYQELEANPGLLGELPCDPPDMVPFVFKLLRIVKSGLIDDEDDEEPPAPSLRLEETSLPQIEVIRDVGLSSLKQSSPRSRRELTKRFTNILSTKFHVPEKSHQTIIDQIFKVVDRDSHLHPLRPLNVIVNIVTVKLRLRTPPSSPVSFGAFLELLDLATDEEEGLVKIGPDSLEAKKQQSCPICMDDFVGKEDASSIASLRKLRSCIHVFHRHCILHWLDKNPVCPLCRCPLSKKRKLEEILPSSTPVGPPSNIPRQI